MITSQKIHLHKYIPLHTVIEEVFVNGGVISSVTVHRHKQLFLIYVMYDYEYIHV